MIKTIAASANPATSFALSVANWVRIPKSGAAFFIHSSSQSITRSSTVWSGEVMAKGNFSAIDCKNRSSSNTLFSTAAIMLCQFSPREISSTIAARTSSDSKVPTVPNTTSSASRDNNPLDQPSRFCKKRTTGLSSAAAPSAKTNGINTRMDLISGFLLWR